MKAAMPGLWDLWETGGMPVSRYLIGRLFVIEVDYTLPSVKSATVIARRCEGLHAPDNTKAHGMLSVGSTVYNLWVR